jgi:hypothetical protein
MIDEALRHVDGENLSRVTDEVGEIERHVAGTAAEVEEALTRPEAGSLPETARVWRPNLMLEPEPEKLHSMRSENVFVGLAITLCHSSPLDSRCSTLPDLFSDG